MYKLAKWSRDYVSYNDDGEEEEEVKEDGDVVSVMKTSRRRWRMKMIMIMTTIQCTIQTVLGQYCAIFLGKAQ